MAEAKKEGNPSVTVTGSNTSVHVDTLTSTTTSPRVDPAIVARVERDREQEVRIETAVFSHIKALRALVKTLVNTAEIADALSIPLQVVDRAVARLKQNKTL